MEMDIGGGGGAMDEERGRRQQRRSSDTLAAHGALADAQQSPALAYSTASPWATTTPQFDAFSPQAQTLGPYPAPPSEGELMTHEGLQVYTVGHLLPRNTYVEDAQGNWSFDPGALTPPDSGLRMAGREQPGAGQGYGGGDEEGDAGEEVVRPTPSAPLGGASSSSATAQAHTSPELSASTPGVASASGPSGATQQKLRVRRSTFVPGWAVPPRVLLVDDDAVSRRLSSKFLKVFGCTTDVAVDGIGAVNKMNLEKYDLVLMDIVMPKLDGVSATNLIRKFDQGTPIISMTSNSKPNEIMTYYSSGMNDILPKPFTKEGLLDMLEKHLMHLKVIQQMSKLSRNIGIPPLSDANFEQALTQGANNLLMMPPPASSAASSPMNALVASSSSPSSSANPNVPSNAPSPFNFQFLGDGAGGEGGDGMGMSAMGRMNPLAGMGLTDEQYGVILQNIVNGDGFAGMMDGLDAAGVAGVGVGVGGMDAGEKRARLDEVEDKRGVKRSRFEVVE
ncbi:SKN7, two-component response regulator [Pholiota molesta]|nr:SKN7, two-component response regulator [Pholiota molesta]